MSKQKSWLIVSESLPRPMKCPSPVSEQRCPGWQTGQALPGTLSDQMLFFKFSFPRLLDHHHIFQPDVHVLICLVMIIPPKLEVMSLRRNSKYQFTFEYYLDNTHFSFSIGV